ncbi:MAG: hypothetical protein U0S49_04775 [Rhodospirillales bacterium]|nr:hypothetical protein [Rhodospirillales bacterium]
MVRIRVPAATAVAVMALSACGTIHGPYPQLGEAGPAIDYVRFPPPPPMPTRPSAPADARAGADVEAELARLNAALGRLTGEIEQSRRHLTDLEAEVERARARIDELLEGAGTARAAAPLPPQQPTVAAGLRPLVRLTYEQAADIDYAEDVRDAVWTALERLPDAVFDVVAVSPAEADPSAGARGTHGEQGVWLHAEEVVASLVAMGIEPERLTLSAAVSEAARADEVHLYIR